MCFFDGDKTCIDIFGILPRLFEYLLESENLVCSATYGQCENPHWVSSSFVPLFRTYVFKVIGIYFSREATERDAPKVVLLHDAIGMLDVSASFAYCSFVSPLLSSVNGFNLLIMVVKIEVWSLIWHFVLCFSYENFRTGQILKAVIPTEEVLSSYTQTGHIAHVNLREHLLPYKGLIGQVTDLCNFCQDISLIKFRL